MLCETNELMTCDSIRYELTTRVTCTVTLNYKYILNKELVFFYLF
jgi:hypothetical protein